MKKSHYIFPAIFHFADDGISVEFPDLPGAYTCGKNEEEALLMAQECLELHLYGMEQDGDEIPTPSHLINIETEKNEIITLIRANMVLARKKINNMSIKKTLTIPKWLNDIAAAKQVNFSLILKNALIEELGLEK